MIVSVEVLNDDNRVIIKLANGSALDIDLPFNMVGFHPHGMNDERHYSFVAPMGGEEGTVDVFVEGQEPYVLNYYE